MQSTDSMDQFCRDFDSSLNLTSEMSLNSATLHLCDNTDGLADACDEEINRKQGFSNDDSLLQTITSKKADQGLSDADKSPSYEG